MKFQSLRTKLLLAVFTLVLGSGLLIAYLVTHRYSSNLFDAMVAQGKHLSQALAFEATDKILTNDVVALQKLLNSQLQSNSNASYVFVVRDGRILAHTFSNGFPLELLNAYENHPPAGRDEVGRLTTSFSHMVDRIRNYTLTLEKNTRDLDRAHRQMRSSFEIIQKIGAKDDLQDVCAYLSAKFQEIVSCSRFAFLIFGSARATLFAFSAGRLSVFERKAFESALPAFSRLDKRTFLRANPFGTPLLPDIFQKA